MKVLDLYKDMEKGGFRRGGASPSLNLKRPPTRKSEVVLNSQGSYKPGSVLVPYALGAVH